MSLKKQAVTKEDVAPETAHRFLDEAGDPTFYKQGRVLAIGEPGISTSFSIGMVQFKTEPADIRSEVIKLQSAVAEDGYLKKLPSIDKKLRQGGFYFHANQDPPEVRMIFYRFIDKLDCSFEMVVARKIPSLFAKNHNHQESEFYADLLSHLIKTKLKSGQRFVLNIAAKGSSTQNANLSRALEIAKERAAKKWRPEEICSSFVFNVQTPRTEPLLTIADYLSWSVYRVLDRGEIRFYEFMKDKISVVVDLYDFDNYKGGKNYYTRKKPLTAKNKISPPLP